ncbi:hypothetical protein BB559_005344 [Furculomyces boomerangus]|uniref:RRM domain-containing protein n=1 Tax=Furculomyces boomerangus TaxID=61424 RepID=A0A2T9Y986_9FUNG|nr:hypothetical protein BB559_005344 [Furculomyces boomerangus]
MEEKRHIIKVTGICPSVDDETIKTIFSFLGDVLQVKTILSPLAYSSKQAFVTFSSKEAADLSLYLSGSELGNQKFKIEKIKSNTLSTTELSLLATNITPGGIGSASYYANPQGYISSPLNVDLSASILNNALTNLINSSAHSIPLSNPAVVSKMLSEPRKLEPIPPELAIQINPIILETDPYKADEICRTVYVGNISSMSTDQHLMEFFERAGPVAYVKMSGYINQPTRFAFIEFASIAAAQAALAMSGVVFEGRPLKINFSKNPINKPPKPGSVSASGVTYTTSILPGDIDQETNRKNGTDGNANLAEDQLMKKIKESQEQLLMKYSNAVKRKSDSHQSKSRSRSRSRGRDRDRKRRESNRYRSRSRSRSSDYNRSHYKRKSSRRDSERDRRDDRYRERTRDRRRTKD